MVFFFVAVFFFIIMVIKSLYWCYYLIHFMALSRKVEDNVKARLKSVIEVEYVRKQKQHPLQEKNQHLQFTQ